MAAEWWAELSAPDIAARIEEMTRKQRCPSLKAMERMFERCENTEQFSAAIHARQQMFKLSRHVCNGSEDLVPVSIAWQKARELRDKDALMALVSNISSCGFEAQQDVFHEVLEVMAQDAPQCVSELPRVLRSMAAQGTRMTPETCHLCCVVCVSAGKPSAAAFVLETYAGLGLRPARHTIEYLRQAGATIKPEIEACVED